MIDTTLGPNPEMVTPVAAQDNKAVVVDVQDAVLHVMNVDLMVNTMKGESSETARTVSTCTTSSSDVSCCSLTEPTTPTSGRPVVCGYEYGGQASPNSIKSPRLLPGRKVRFSEIQIRSFPDEAPVAQFLTVSTLVVSDMPAFVDDSKSSSSNKSSNPLLGKAARVFKKFVAKQKQKKKVFSTERPVLVDMEVDVDLKCSTKPLWNSVSASHHVCRSSGSTNSKNITTKGNSTSGTGSTTTKPAKPQLLRRRVKSTSDLTSMNDESIDPSTIASACQLPQQPKSFGSNHKAIRDRSYSDLQALAEEAKSAVKSEGDWSRAVAQSYC